MILTTCPFIPGVNTYQILGIVSVTATGLSNPNIDKAIKELEKDAQKLKATAVIGIQMNTMHSIKLGANYDVTLIGTAIQY